MKTKLTPKDIQLALVSVLDGKVRQLADFESEFDLSRSVSFKLIGILKRHLHALFIQCNRDGSLDPQFNSFKKAQSNQLMLDFVFSHADLIRQMEKQYAQSELESKHHSSILDARLPRADDVQLLTFLETNPLLEETLAAWRHIANDCSDDIAKVDQVQEALVKVLSSYDFSAVLKVAKSPATMRLQAFLHQHHADFNNVPTLTVDPLTRRLDSAIALLSKHGYTVIAPPLPEK